MSVNATGCGGPTAAAGRCTPPPGLRCWPPRTAARCCSRTPCNRSPSRYTAAPSTVPCRWHETRRVLRTEPGQVPSQGIAQAACHSGKLEPAAATDWSATDQRATPSDSATFLCQLIQVTLCHGCLAHQARNAAAGLPVKGQHLAEVHSVAMAEQDRAWRLPPRGRVRNVRCNDLLAWRALPAAAGGYAQHRAAEHFAAAPAATVHSG